MKHRSLFIFLFVFFVLAQAGCSPIESSKSTSNKSSFSFNQNSQQEKAVAPDSQSDGYENVNPSSFSSIVEKITVEPESQIDYDRDLFGNWIDDDRDGCNTREEVLQAESLIPIGRDSNCKIISGEWYSAFDEIVTSDPSDLQIDHFVPLSEAWKSGAYLWTNETRLRFANDLEFEKSLIAVTGSSNSSKGNRDPANWMPSNSSYHCQYIVDWVLIKLRWSLSVDTEELSAINRISNECKFTDIDLTLPDLAIINLEQQRTVSSSPKADSPDDPAGCRPDQVDINKASINELQRIIHIGQSRSLELIQLRPFTSVNDLTKINGIAAARLQDIISQGIACVD